MTAHLEVADGHDPRLCPALCEALRERFAIDHATVQLESSEAAGDCRQAHHGARVVGVQAQQLLVDRPSLVVALQMDQGLADEAFSTAWQRVRASALEEAGMDIPFREWE